MNPPFVRINLDLDEIVKLYEAGQSLAQVAETLGSNRTTIARRLRQAGVELRTRAEGTRRRVNDDGGAQARDAAAIAAERKRAAAQAPLAPHVRKIVAEYEAGASLRALSERYGCPMNAIRVALDTHGTGVRSQSAAGRVRTRDEAERQRIRSAIAATTGRRRTEAELTTMALAKQRFQVKVGEGEEMLGRLLAERGLETVPQQPVDRYNIDLGAFPVAVEVHRGPHHPFSRPALMRRLEHLESRGWLIGYVWVSGRYRPITAEIADELVAWVQLVRSDPAARREHRVFRGEPQLGSRNTQQTSYPSSVPASSGMSSSEGGETSLG